MTMKLPYLRILFFIMALVLSMPLYAQEMTNAVPDKNNKKVIKRYNSYQHRSTYSGGFYPELYQKDRFFERLGGDQYTITNCEYGYGGIDRYRKVDN